MINLATSCVDLMERSGVTDGRRPPATEDVRIARPDHRCGMATIGRDRFGFGCKSPRAMGSRGLGIAREIITESAAALASVGLMRVTTALIVRSAGAVPATTSKASPSCWPPYFKRNIFMRLRPHAALKAPNG